MANRRSFRLRRNGDENKEESGTMVGGRGGKRQKNGSSSEEEAGFGGDYEEKRAQRMKENMERLKELGISDLSKQLKPEKVPLPKKRAAPLSKFLDLNDPPRRSSRLMIKDPINYSERKPPKEENVKKNVVISIKEGAKPEVYTEEHDKLLGDCKTDWTLGVDGYDGEGGRIYDPYLGKSCHQCRQKTLGHRTRCSNCNLVSGQFCGECLYTRYGENVIEVSENPEWICPVCRGICNCSRCRRKKGWEPTGLIYEKVKSLGFKSVAHYLIQTFRSGPKTEEPINKSADHVSVSLSHADEEDDPVHSSSSVSS
ncbi:OLC1v1008539C1 [Oldenlandia corymbosa var. corymbosa]|uniref:OLC1v1008539C1 n=1 Tax=Oldenlandia corymbosa var. corymbosa TaxID=529605 RepID=A0AAV1DP94_OLDCO|nr:OLC1v1008539C1 [Oldenlandia corymbosa var. corymbosa]